MKKIFELFMVTVLCLTVVSCGSVSEEAAGDDTVQSNVEKSETVSENSENGSAEESVEEPVVIINPEGSYVNAGLYNGSTLVLNSNTTFDKTGDYNPDVFSAPKKGTYVANENGFVLNFTDSSEPSENYVKYGEYFYEESYYLDKDQDYGLDLTFDENGRTNQWFEEFSKIDGPCIVLQFKEDGTYKLRRCVRYYGSRSEGIVFEGTYTVEDNAVKMKYDAGVFSIDVVFATALGMDSTKYTVENGMANFAYDAGEFTILMIDGKAYYNVIKLAE